MLLYEIAYKLLQSSSDVDYALAQVIANNIKEAEEKIKEIYSKFEIVEFKLLKVTPSKTPFVTYMTYIPNRIYNQFECISEENASDSSKCDA